jgi:hypothetical protein
VPGGPVFANPIEFRLVRDWSFFGKVQSIENGLHWVLDVVFREDARRLYDRTAAENTAFLNRLALSLLRGDPTKGSLKVKRKRAGRNIAYLAKLLGFPSI